MGKYKKSQRIGLNDQKVWTGANAINISGLLVTPKS